MAVFRKLFMFLALSALLAGCGRPDPMDELAVALTAAAGQAQNAGGNVTQPTLAPTLTAAATPTSGECLAEVTRNNINMRRAPDGDIIGCCLAEGEELEVFQFSSDREWARIESVEVPAHRGWVDVRFLRLYGDCGE